MRNRLTLFFGIFAVMALSNAIVPVLPYYGTGSSIHGLIYAAYFLGAFLTTLPAGILSDRFGRTPLIRLGLAITVISGLFLALNTGTYMVLAARLAEGIGAGLFVAAALSWVNADRDHVRLSGWLMASMNAGLVAGLLVSGWLATYLPVPVGGILVFSLAASLPALAAFLVEEPSAVVLRIPEGTVFRFLIQFRWLWFSSVILIGITGVLTSLYPRFSGAPSDLVGLWTAGMSVATIIAVLVYSRTRLSPVPVIRTVAVLFGIAVFISYVTPAGFLLIGALAGIVMIAQMAFLAGVQEFQGVIMGLFSTMSYLGMALLPAIAGLVADGAGFFAAFFLAALCAGTVAVTIGRCSCPP
ncbi:MAG: MFS transporter [Methanomicrobiales archaeon]|nr:MFS transporter [Methanomicrobiales archaeon]